MAKRGGEKEFGLTFAGVCLLVAGISGWKGSGAWPGWAAAAAVFVAAGLFAPRLLAPFNRAWLAFGEVLHKIMSPLIMGVLFFAVVTPVGLLMRACGKDPLRLRLDPDAASYWLPRDPPGPQPETIRRQF